MMIFITILTLFNTGTFIWLLFIKGNLSFSKSENSYFKLTTGYNVF